WPAATYPVHRSERDASTYQRAECASPADHQWASPGSVLTNGHDFANAASTSSATCGSRVPAIFSPRACSFSYLTRDEGSPARNEMLRCQNMLHCRAANLGHINDAQPR